QHTSASHDLKVIKYGNGIIFLKFYNDSTSLPANFKTYWINLLKELSVDETAFHVGINDTVLPMSRLDISMKRSIYACRSCRKSLSGVCTYSELGYMNIIYSLSDNAYAAEYLTEIIEKIQPDCDTLSGFKKSDIYPTLKACVDNDFDIAKTAEVLFQHPNTIRYRLRKTKEVLQIDDEMTFRILVTILVSL
ncbi:MAG: PucR family transcriptional regulator, partial [Lachnospiraceae bacterium]